MDFKSTKEIFLRYPKVELISICQLISNSQTWTYTDEFGGIRVSESDNFINSFLSFSSFSILFS